MVRIRDKTHLWVRHDHIDVRHDSFLCVTWLDHVCGMIRVWDMTILYVRHIPFLRVTCIIHTRDMTHSYVWYISSIYQRPVVCQPWRHIHVYVIYWRHIHVYVISVSHTCISASHTCVCDIGVTYMTYTCMWHRYDIHIHVYVISHVLTYMCISYIQYKIGYICTTIIYQKSNISSYITPKELYIYMYIHTHTYIYI